MSDQERPQPDENGRYPAKPFKEPVYDPHDMPPFPACKDCGYLHAR